MRCTSYCSISHENAATTRPVASELPQGSPFGGVSQMRRQWRMSGRLTAKAITPSKAASSGLGVASQVCTNQSLNIAGESQILVNGGVQVAKTPVVLGFTGEAVGDRGNRQVIVDIAKADRGLRPAMTERVFRTVPTEAVRNSLFAVSIGVDDDSESEVNLVLEGAVVEADTLAHSHGRRRMGAEVVVKLREVVNWPSPRAAGTGRGTHFRRMA